MINRRAFLSKSWLGALIPGLMMGEQLQPSQNPYYHYTYKGYLIRWTGWKTICNQDELAGQWTANSIKEEGRKHIYSAVPGAVGFYFPGDSFNLCLNAHRDRNFYRRGADSYARGSDFDLNPWQQLVNSRTPEPIKDEQKNMGLKDLIHFIDAHGEDAVATLRG